MAQMAAQDYFSRLQMSGMVHHPDMANFASLGALNSMHNNSSGASSSSSSGNKHNLKRKEKSSNQDDMNKYNNSKDASYFDNSTKKITPQITLDFYYQNAKMANMSQAMSMHNTLNLQKELMAMSAAAAAQMKEKESQMSKSKKGKNTPRSSFSNNKSMSQNTSRAKDNPYDLAAFASMKPSDLIQAAGYSK
jgi:hypothetical protein